MTTPNPAGLETGPNRNIRSAALPGGNLFAALLNRPLMNLADRGGSSGLVGNRWADLCADEAERWSGTTLAIPDADAGLQVERVVRLDHVPQVASIAARAGLQNPDLLFVGRTDAGPALMAADAKFSVETARAKQVSPEMLRALLDLGPRIGTYLGGLPDGAEPVRGIFLSPATELTASMLDGMHGITKTTVRPDEVVAVPADAGIFFTDLEGADLIPALAKLDRLGDEAEGNLLAGLYEFRIARAAIGCWGDQVRPLLAWQDRVDYEPAAVLAEIERRARGSRTAYDLLRAWDRDAEVIREQRATIDHAAGLPVMSRELRSWVERSAAALHVEAPSLNQVRRRLGAWHRAQVREEVGPLEPPVEDIATARDRVARASAALVPRLPAETRRIVEEIAQGRFGNEVPIGPA